MTSATLLYFLGASMALTIAPGPDNIFVLTQGITRGRQAAIVTALGMCSGISVHTVAAACGISALLHTSALAFDLVKFAGAAYLLHLAWKSLKSTSSIGLAAPGTGRAAVLFRRGFLMNVLNPKVAMFFLAFLPQFVSPTGGNPVFQMLLLGLIFMVQAIVIFCLIGWFSGTIGNYILTRPHLSRRFDLLTAGVFASLGIRLVLAER